MHHLIATDVRADLLDAGLVRVLSRNDVAVDSDGGRRRKVVRRGLPKRMVFRLETLNLIGQLGLTPNQALVQILGILILLGVQVIPVGGNQGVDHSAGCLPVRMEIRDVNQVDERLITARRTLHRQGIDYVHHRVRRPLEGRQFAQPMITDGAGDDGVALDEVHVFGPLAGEIDRLFIRRNCRLLRHLDSRVRLVGRPQVDVHTDAEQQPDPQTGNQQVADRHGELQNVDALAVVRLMVPQRSEVDVVCGLLRCGHVGSLVDSVHRLRDGQPAHLAGRTVCRIRPQNAARRGCGRKSTQSRATRAKNSER